jgi:hypothetical protein
MSAAWARHLLSAQEIPEFERQLFDLLTSASAPPHTKSSVFG